MTRSVFVLGGLLVGFVIAFVVAQARARTLGGKG